MTDTSRASVEALAEWAEEEADSRYAGEVGRMQMRRVDATLRALLSEKEAAQAAAEAADGLHMSSHQIAVAAVARAEAAEARADDCDADRRAHMARANEYVRSTKEQRARAEAAEARVAELEAERGADPASDDGLPIPDDAAY